ncbi:MAG: hypothetical protein ACREKH_09635 [Candidatus Rokuibacteriota bacterium]
MLSLHFPTGVLFDLLRRGGPLPARYAHLGAALVRHGPLDFEPEEAIEIRDWLEDEPEDLVDDAVLDAAAEVVNEALQRADLCLECGGVVRVTDQRGELRCAQCGESAEA